MPSILLLATLFAAPSEFREVRQKDDCIYYKDDSEPVPVVRTECEWPEADGEKLRAILSDYGSYAKLIGPVERSEQIEVHPDRTLVEQVHNPPVIARRELRIWMWAETLEDGGLKVSWDSDGVEPWELEPGHVRPERNAGFWEIHPRMEGGIVLVHQVEYLPGGSVPRWLVKAFQTGGVVDLMQNTRKLAAPVP